MKSIGTKLGKNYAWELQCIYCVREWSSGLTFFNLEVQSDWYACDHKPSFEIELVLLNITIFNFNIYNVWHADDRRSPMYKKYMEEECKYHGVKYEES